MRHSTAALLLLGVPLVSGCSVFDLLHWVEAPVDLVLMPVDTLRAHGFVSEAEEPGPMEAALYARAEETDQRHLIANTTREEDDPKLWARGCDAGDPDACGRAAGLFVYFFHERKYGLEVWEMLCDGGRGEYCLRAGDVYVAKLVPGSPHHTADSLYLTGCEASAPSALACRKSAEKARARAARRGNDRWSQQSRESLLLEDRACALGEWHACYDLGLCLEKGGCGFVPDRVLADYYGLYAGRRALGELGDHTYALDEAMRLERLRALEPTPPS